MIREKDVQGKSTGVIKRSWVGQRKEKYEFIYRKKKTQQDDSVNVKKEVLKLPGMALAGGPIGGPWPLLAVLWPKNW